MEHLISDAMEGLQEVLRVEFLCCCKQAIDIPGDEIVECFHAMFIMQAVFLLLRLDHPQNGYLLGVVEAIDELDALPSRLPHHFRDIFAC
jgi:hypothetical protein